MSLAAMNQGLAVAAHPDDKVVGCGGNIARHVDSVDQVQVLIVAESATSRQQERDRAQGQDELSALAKAAQTAGSILSAMSVELLDLLDNHLDSLDRLDLIRRIQECVERHKQECIYTHHASDAEVDYRRLHEVVVMACRPTPVHVVKRLLSYEVASSTEWQPPGAAPAFQTNWFIDISDQWECKREALLAYSTEMHDSPHLHSLEAIDYLAFRSGAQEGIDAAEALCLQQQLV